MTLVAQQQIAGAERPGGQDQNAAAQPVHGQRRQIDRRAFVVRLMPDVPDLEAAIGGPDLPHLAAVTQLGAGPGGGGQEVVVEGVLAAGVAADVTFAAQAAGQPGCVVVQVGSGPGNRAARALTRGGEADGQRGQPPLDAEAFRGLPHRPGLRGGLHQRLGIRGGAEHLLDPVVVLVELGAGHRPGLVAALGPLVVGKPALILAEHYVRVNQRSAAQAAGHHRLHVPERPDVEQALQARARVPEVAGHLAGAPRERARRVPLAPFEHAHRAPRLGQPAGDDRAAESRPDHYRVDRFYLCISHLPLPPALLPAWEKRREEGRLIHHARGPRRAGPQACGPRACGRASGPRTAGPSGKSDDAQRRRQLNAGARRSADRGHVLVPVSSRRRASSWTRHRPRWRC